MRKFKVLKGISAAIVMFAVIGACRMDWDCMLNCQASGADYFYCKAMCQRCY